jgi:hypothetical protein
MLSACKSIEKANKRSLTQIPANILGKFEDDYGSNYTITNMTWLHASNMKYNLLKFNAKDNYLIVQNDTTNPSDGGLYTRIDFLNFKDMEPWRWGYCLTTYNAKTVEEAENTPPADRSNPRKGCAGFPFTRMKTLTK